MVERADLAEELDRLAAEDLAVRQRLVEAGELYGHYNSEMREVHRRNGDRLTAILDEVGTWPGHRLVGADGSRAALLIAQHDVANPALMRRCLVLYAAAVNQGDAEPAGLAYLEDRILAFEGRSQRYGTQVGWDDEGVFGPWPPVAEPYLVDEHRAKLGLGPLAEAIRSRAAESAPRRSVAEVLDERRRGEDFARESGWTGTNGEADRPR